MLKPRALTGVDSDIAENASATDALEPAAARPKEAFWEVAALIWPATARVAGAAIDMVINDMVELRSLGCYTGSQAEMRRGVRGGCTSSKIDVDEFWLLPKLFLLAKMSKTSITHAQLGHPHRAEWSSIDLKIRFFQRGRRPHAPMVSECK